MIEFNFHPLSSLIIEAVFWDLPVMRAVRAAEGRKEEQSSVTCSAVEFEPKPLGPAIPAKYLSVAFMALECCKDKWHLKVRLCKHMQLFLYITYNISMITHKV